MTFLGALVRRWAQIEFGQDLLSTLSYRELQWVSLYTLSLHRNPPPMLSLEAVFARIWTTVFNT